MQVLQCTDNHANDIVLHQALYITSVVAATYRWEISSVYLYLNYAILILLMEGHLSHSSVKFIPSCAMCFCISIYTQRVLEHVYTQNILFSMYFTHKQQIPNRP